ncbi:MiaB-like tRNA modifying enzyme, archaeal-type [Allomyces macrogynus ATCC 38327]|uniref:Threonylcarbamoyladenosine tRNA methylthiotransferase n=1 Tax=Allomyces macrogynus (strain ATCC 38327) TaxID=578462 RepID=A0A0L0SN10_ALLM3|nr:MiaB-like tRNA modifying enzyme, archaeal-type [Allomyces macrogynus ATCC 38327]|eukprot:KNE63754.1 MiaB-like tRNA modifying enzyme, archaeal-type [Allomyces macrogynus ATCC 38327]
MTMTDALAADVPNHEPEALDDIEELTVAVNDATASRARSSYRHVAVKRFGRRNRNAATENDGAKNDQDDDEDDEGSDLESGPLPESSDFYAPGKAKVYVRTWGCSHNNSDSEYMAGILASHGYTIVATGDDADLWVLNGCTVKNPSEQTFVNAIRQAQDKGKKVVLAGCVTQAAPRNKMWDGLSIIGVQQIDEVVYVVEETLLGHSVRLMDPKKEPGTKVRAGGAKLALPKIRKNPLIEIIAINTGCLNQCTYCKTKHARGELASYPVAEIVARVRQVLAEGIVEIWLTSEDTGTYGRDIGTDLPTLLWAILAELPTEGSVMLRVGMTNPPYILEHLPAMAEILRDARVYAFLHVPVQAAADRVLLDMRRQYSQAEFRQVVDYLREHVPGMTIATDIICGFPTESDADFDETLDLVREYQFPVLHISQFYPRPGTPAARMPRLPTQVVKQRSRAITALFESYHPYDHLRGETMRVLVTDTASDGKHYVAHNKAYQQVLVPMRDGYLGKLLDVEIVDTAKHCLFGRPVGAPSGGPKRDESARIEEPVGDERKVTARKVNSGARLPASAASPPAAEEKKVTVVTATQRRLAQLALLVAILCFAAVWQYEASLFVQVPAYVVGLVALFFSVRTTGVPVAEFRAGLNEGGRRPRAVGKMKRS